jgi:hypothetical protein
VAAADRAGHRVDSSPLARPVSDGRSLAGRSWPRRGVAQIGASPAATVPGSVRKQFDARIWRSIVHHCSHKAKERVMVEPTAYEQYILELINRARANPGAEAARLGIDLNQGLAAGTISTAAKQPLAFNPLLIDAARGHSA